MTFWTGVDPEESIVTMTTIIRAILLGAVSASFWACQALIFATMEAAVLPIHVLGADRAPSAVFFTLQLAMAALAIGSVALGATVRNPVSHWGGG